MEKDADTSMELIGTDAAGAPLRKVVAAGQDALQLEGEIRFGGGRVLRTELRRAPRAAAAIAPEDFARFNEMLGDALRRGLPLPDGLRRLCFQSRGGRFRRSVEATASRLEQGMPLAQALEAEGSAFPPFYGRLLKAGAAAGNLSEVLLNLSRNVRMNVAFRRALLTNVVYPLLLLLFSAAMLIAAGLVLIPQSFAPVAGSVDMRIPTLTEFMTGQTLQSRVTLAVLALMVLGGALTWMTLRRRLESSRLTDAVARRLPYFRSFYEAALWSNASDMLALLVRAQTPAPEAFRLAGDALGRPWVSRAMEQIAARVERGESAGAAADGLRVVPRRFARALLAADVSGSMDRKLESLAEEYRNEAERRAENFIRYLPVAAALAMGLVVLLVAATLLGPYFRFWGARW